MGMSSMLQTIDDRPTYSYNNQVTTEQALDAYIQADGNIHLAAERTYGDNNHLAQYLDLLSQDHVSLQRLLRTRVLLNLFTVFEQSQSVLIKGLDMMDSEDIAKTFIGIASTLEKMTASQQNIQLNIHEYMLRQLPPEAREAFQILTAPSESIIKLGDD